MPLHRVSVHIHRSQTDAVPGEMLLDRPARLQIMGHAALDAEVCVKPVSDSTFDAVKDIPGRTDRNHEVPGLYLAAMQSVSAKRGRIRHNRELSHIQGRQSKRFISTRRRRSDLRSQPPCEEIRGHMR